MLCLFPLICGPRMHVPHFLLAILSVAASACSIAAFVVGAYLSASVISGFKHAGDSTNLGAAVSGPTVLVSALSSCLSGGC